MKKEMEWISVKEKKPDKDMIALVFNEKGWMRGIRAIYHHTYDIWVMDDPNYRELITLEVSHYLPIPEYPLIVWKC